MRTCPSKRNIGRKLVIYLTDKLFGFFTPFVFGLSMKPANYRWALLIVGIAYKGHQYSFGRGGWQTARREIERADS
jgi:hypothetical protein